MGAKNNILRIFIVIKCCNLANHMTLESHHHGNLHIKVTTQLANNLLVFVLKSYNNQSIARRVT